MMLSFSDDDKNLILHLSERSLRFLICQKNIQKKLNLTSSFTTKSIKNFNFQKKGPFAIFKK